MFQTKYFCQFLLFFFLHYSFVFSYKIDSSCATEGVEELVRRSMLSAFGMAESARRRLVSRPLDPETKELLGYMLLKENIDTAELEKPGKLNKIINIYQNIIGHFKEEVKDDDPIDEDDVVIFCNLARFVPVPGKLLYVRDSSNGILMKFNQPACKGSLADVVALASTYNPQTVPNSQNVVRPTQIQLCPWFIDWLKMKTFKQASDLSRTKIGKYFIDSADAKQRRWGFRPIDVLNLLDKVLLHEMTHARAVFESFDSTGEVSQEGILDVGDPNSWLPFIGISPLPAYGWTRAMGLARKGDELGGPKAPDNNADTLALIGAVCKLLDNTEMPRKVDIDGNLVDMPKPEPT